MSSVDQRVVEMKFDRGAFAQGVKSTLSDLDNLKKGLQLKGATYGLESVSKAASKFSLRGMYDSLTQAMGGFSALGVAAATTFATITHQALQAGTQLVKSLTLDPVMQGFSEYELKMGSIQTVLANTARHGTTLETVNDELDKLNKYADKTIYNFAEMTKNASLFTNSGMKIEDATTVIKGFSNSAAASGTNAQGAAGAAYQLSQALSSGMVRLMDWRSLTNVGMGGENMKEGIITMAKAMGTLEEGSETAQLAMTDFNSSLEKKWLTADVMSTYLKAMSGDMDDAALAALGLNAEQIKVIQSQAKMGLEAATKVRTLSQLMSTLKEAVASGWTDSFEIVFGTFDEATDTFTRVSDTIGGILGKSAEARNKVLADWKEMGGRTALLDGIKNIFEALTRVIGPIRDAFQQVFPPMTGKRLYELTDAFRDLMAKLRLGDTAMQNLKRTFAGIFSVFKIIQMVVLGAVKAFFSLFMTVGEGGSGILGITALIGDFLTSIQRLLTYSGLIEKFFAVLTSPLIIIKPLIALISDLVAAFSLLFAGDVSGFSKSFKGAFESFGNVIGGVFDAIQAKFKGFTDAIASVFTGMSNMLGHISSTASNAGNSLVSNLAKGLSAVTTFLAAFMTDARGTIENLASVLSSAGDSGKNFFASLGGDGLSKLGALADWVREKFDALKGSLDFSGVFSSFNSGASQMSAGGGTILSGVAGAIESIWNGLKGLSSGIGGFLGPILSELSAFFTTISQKLREYISGLDMQDAIAVVNTGVFIAMYLMIFRFVKRLSGMVGDLKDLFETISDTFGQLTSTLKTMQTNIRANIILKIATAVAILVAAIYTLSKIDGEALKKALIALTVVFAQVAAMLLVVTKIDPKSMAGSAGGMVLLAVAIRILASAIEKLGEMDPKVLIQGGIALGVMMAALAGMVRVINGMKGIFVAAAGLLILAAALTAMTVPLLIFSKIPWDVLEHGLVAMGLTLIAIAAGMTAMPKNMILQAAALVIMANALVIFAGVIAIIGTLPADTVKQGLISIAIGLGILAVAARAMTGALSGAAAILIIAAALTMLVPVLIALGQLDISTIVVGLMAIAGLLGVLAIAGLAAPAIAALGAAMLLLGGAMLLAGAGFALFAAGLTAVVAIGAAGFGVLLVGIQGFLNLLPLMAQQLGHAVIAFAAVIGAAAPKLMEAAGKIILAFIQEIHKLIPKIAESGLKMIIALLTAIRNKIGEITNLVIDIVTIFITTLTGRLPKIIQSGVDFILSFVEGLAKAIRGEKERVGEAGSDLAMAIVEGMIAGIKAFIKLLPPQIEALANAAVVAFKKFLGINSPSTVFAGFGGDIVMGVIQGIGKFIGNLGSKAKELGLRAISGAKEGIANAASAGTEFVTKIVNGVGGAARSLGSKAKEIISGAIIDAKMAAGKALDIGKAIVNGIVKGIGGGLSLVTNAAKNLAKGALNSAKNFLGIESPSKEFEKIGKFVNEGFVKGLLGNKESVRATYNTMSEMLKNATEKANEDIKRHEEKLKSLTEKRDENTESLKRANAELAKANTAGEKEKARDKIKDLTKAQTENSKAIQETTAVLAIAREESKKTSEARVQLTKDFADEAARLERLAGRYEHINGQLEKANQALADAKKVRDDYEKSISDQYSKNPEIDAETKLADYVEDLKIQVRDTAEFTKALDKLKDLGLNDQVYKDLLAEGIDAIPFVNQLLEGGIDAINEVNTLTANLEKQAKTLGKKSSTALYEAGVQTAEGLVKGIKARRSAVINEMEALANAMLAAMKKTLGIKSPSREFNRLGKFSVAGMVEGLKSSTSGVTKAASDIGDEALVSLRDSLSDISKVMLGEIDANPVITPVLDLSAVRKESAKMGALLDTPLSLDGAYSTAKSASAAYRNNQATKIESSPAGSSSEFTFIQNNTSPKALSQAEIYRQTKNQLSVVKTKLEEPANA